MDVNQKTIEIARFFGWKEWKGRYLGGTDYNKERWIWISPTGLQCNEEAFKGELPRFFPRYFQDLHVCARMEMALTDIQLPSYIQHLFMITNNNTFPDTPCAMTFTEAFSLCRATASQRAEAFGKTLNLW